MWEPKVLKGRTTKIYKASVPIQLFEYQLTHVILNLPLNGFLKGFFRALPVELTQTGLAYFRLYESNMNQIWGPQRSQT